MKLVVVFADFANMLGEVMSRRDELVLNRAVQYRRTSALLSNHVLSSLKEKRGAHSTTTILAHSGFEEILIDKARAEESFYFFDTEVDTCSISTS